MTKNDKLDILSWNSLSKVKLSFFNIKNINLNEMKKKFLFLFVLIIPLACYSQNITSADINILNDSNTGLINGVMLGENLIGPRKIVFSGNQMTLKREDEGNKIPKFGYTSSKIDRLETLYSGKIFSEGIIEPFVFENKTPEEIIAMEVLVFPKFLEHPYSLFIDLLILVPTKQPSLNLDHQSYYAGKYRANLVVEIIGI